jgi:hypothetical protein
MNIEVSEVASFLSAANEPIGDYYIDFLNHLVKPYQEEISGTFSDSIAADALSAYTVLVILTQKNLLHQMIHDSGDNFIITEPEVDGQVVAKKAEVSFLIYDERKYHPYSDINELVDFTQAHTGNLTKEQIGSIIKNNCNYLLSSFHNLDDLYESLSTMIIDFHIKHILPSDFDVQIKIGMSTYTLNMSISLSND